MTEQDKKLLLKDLCARLPYGVICHTSRGNGHLNSINQTIFEVEYWINISPIKRDCFSDSKQNDAIIKHYLRPMSSMTEDEKEEYCHLQDILLCSSQYPVTDAYRLFDWLNAHYLDYRGLIPKGLAIEAPKDMYKIE